METGQNPKKNISEMINEYKKNHGTVEADGNNISSQISSTQLPNKEQYKPEQFQQVMQKETDPDLIISYELVDLPSKGMFYQNKISQLEVEYMTSKDEDLITTPSLIESGKVLDILLKKKIKTKGVNPSELLPGDRNAILLFLRTSSYGLEYPVEIFDPRTGTPFKETIDLGKLTYKEPKEIPNENGHFNVFIPMRKKNVMFRLLSSGEENSLFKKSEEIKEAYGMEYSEYNTLKLKANIISIDGNNNRDYINKFVDAMPAKDSLTIRRKIAEVSPDVDMTYEFTTKDGYKFKTQLTVGVDFFFPVN
jgi:hypothetical protein